MATLFIDFDRTIPTHDKRGKPLKRPPRELPPAYKLSRWPEKDPTDDQDNASLSILNAVRIHGSSNPIVYRGSLYTTSDSDTSVDVVVKLIYGKSCVDRLVKESGFYMNEARDIQGTAIPFFRGLFQGATVNGLVTCLVLDYCGESLKVPFDNMDIDFRLKVLEKLMDLHDAGLLHGDTRESNVVVNDGQPFIIDLEHARPHKCRRKLSVDAGAFCPNRDDFDCWEIYDIAQEMGLWLTGMVDYLGMSILLGTVKSEEDLAAIAPFTYLDTEDGRAEARRRAKIAWRELEEMRNLVITYPPH